MYRKTRKIGIVVLCVFFASTLFAERVHFLKTNEFRLYLLEPYIRNKRGAYIGVGTDQNLTLISWAHSRRAWLLDVDPVATAINRIHLYFISLAKTAHEFERLWSATEKSNSYLLLKQKFQLHKEWELIRYAFLLLHRSPESMERHFARLKKCQNFKRFYLNYPVQYNHLRILIKNKKISIVRGDIRAAPLSTISMQARKEGQKITVLYTSNVEQYTGITHDYLENLRTIPVTSHSILIRTFFRGGDFLKKKFSCKNRKFHYNFQKIAFLQRLRFPLSATKRISLTCLLHKRVFIKRDLSFIPEIEQLYCSQAYN